MTAMTAAEALATLSDTEAAELLALVRSRRVASGEDRAEAEAAEYAAKIAERAAREAADPELQRSRRAASLEAQRKQEQERKTTIADLEALAKVDPRIAIQARIDSGEQPRHRCAECRVHVFEVVMTRAVILCGPCNARHRLHCDQCGAGKNVLARLCSDHMWRCEPCAAEYRASVEAAG